MLPIFLGSVLFSFFMGTIIGSFLNVCIYRIPIGKTVVSGRSFCPWCKHTLAWYDLAPILSFLCLNGKCRYCKSKISPRYPAIECLTGILFALAFSVFLFSIKTILVCLVFSALVVAAMIDFDTGEIPDRISIFLVLIAAVSYFFPGFPTLSERLIGMVCISVPMLLAAIFANGFGGGDIKLTAAFGLIFGWKLSLCAILFAVIPAGIMGIYLLLRKKASGKTELIFGPYLAVGMIAAVLYGEIVIKSYLELLM